MAAWNEITTIGNVEDELTRLRDLVKIVYSIVDSRDCNFSDIRAGLQWMVSDIEGDVTRIIAGLQKIEETRS
jgi:hypothetical protein